MYRKDSIFVGLLLMLCVVATGTCKEFASEKTTTFASDAVQRLRTNSANLSKNVDNFYFYPLPSRPGIFNILKGGSRRGNYVYFIGKRRYERAIYNKTYTGNSYTFTTFGVIPFTAMFLLDENSGPETYEIEVHTYPPSDQKPKFDTFAGSVTMQNYTLQYGGLQDFATQQPTFCEVYFYLPLSPNVNRTFSVSTSYHDTRYRHLLTSMSMTNKASVQSGSGEAVLGYILLSKPHGEIISKTEINATMLTMMRIILGGDRTEIFGRFWSNTGNLTRNVENFYSYPIPVPPDVYYMYQTTPRSRSPMHGRNQIYYKVGNTSRIRAAYNKTYTGPSYIFSTVTIHTMTAMYFLDANSGPESYSIEVDSSLYNSGDLVVLTFKGSVSLLNYTLKYEGVQGYFYKNVPNICEVYFYLPLTSNSNRKFSVVLLERTKWHLKNKASVEFGQGEAVLGYTLLSKLNGVQIWNEEIEATMLTMLHIILGVEQSVWSTWTIWSANGAACREEGIQSRTRNCTSGPCLKTSSAVESQRRPCSVPAWIAGIFNRVRTNSPDVSRNIKNSFSYHIFLPKSPNATSIEYSVKRNYVYFEAGQEPPRLAIYNRSYSGPSYFFETFSIEPFTAMFVLDGNSDNKSYSIQVKSALHRPGTGRFRTYQGSVSLRNYTLQFKVAQHYLNRAKTYCEVYYLLPLTSESNHTMVFVASDYKRKFSENKASVLSGGGPAVLGYTLLMKHKGIKISMGEIRETMLSMMHLILGIDQQVWSHWTHWSSCPDNCPGQRAQTRLRSCFSGQCPNERVKTETRPCSIPVWVADIFKRFRSDHRNLTRLVENFYRYLLPIPTEVSHYIDHSLDRDNRLNFVSFKVGEGRFKTVLYNRKYTGPSYTFATFATHPFTAMFVLDSNSGPQGYAIQVSSDFAEDGSSKFGTFRGSVTWLNYTMKYGGAQIFSYTRISTDCRILFFLPLTPNLNRELNFSTTVPEPWYITSKASVRSGSGAAVLGYTLLSRPVGIQFSEDEIKAVMSTMMHIILGGDKSEILERVQSNSCNLRRDVANYYSFPLPTRSEETLIKDGGGKMFNKYGGGGNQLYFRIGDEPRQLVVYNKTYRGPSYIFATFAVHPFTAVFLLDEKSGPQRYLIGVISEFETYGRGLFENFEGSVSVRNYTLKYRGTQMHSIKIPTTCEVYFFLPLSPNSNRRFVLWLKKSEDIKYHWFRRTILDYKRRTENRAFVRSGGGKAVLGYTLLSKSSGAKVTKEEIEETMFTMMHLLVGADQSVWSLWTAWSASTARCRQTGVQSRSRDCTSGSCLQTSTTVQTQSRPFSGLTCIAGDIFQRFPNVSRNLTNNIPSFHFYELPTHNEPTKIHYDSGKMYTEGNRVYFQVDNASRQLAVYNKSYSGASYKFSTFSIRPFTALFVLDFDSRPERRYSIMVQSTLNVPRRVYDFGGGKFETFEGWVYLENNALQFKGVQVHSARFPTVCEVYFYLPLSWNLNPRLIVSTPYNKHSYFRNEASLQCGSGKAILGYTLLSKIDHTKISKEEIEATMSTMLQFILVG